MTQTNFVRHHRSQPDGLPRGQACDFVAIDFETANALRSAGLSTPSGSSGLAVATEGV